MKKLLIRIIIILTLAYAVASPIIHHSAVAAGTGRQDNGQDKGGGGN